MKFLTHLGLAVFLSSCAANTTNSSDNVRNTDFFLWSDGRLDRLPDVEAGAELYYDAFKPDASVQAGALNWQIAYADITSGSRLGFGDPLEGADRRRAFEEALRIVGDTLASDTPVTLRVKVNPSRFENTPNLAAAGTFYSSAANGFFSGHLAKHIISGVDPEPLGPDMQVDFNFFHDFHTGTDRAPVGIQDMTTVAIHEIGHALGIASLLDASGKSLASGGNPGVFTTFDWLLRSSSRTRIMSPGGNFIGTPSDLVGINGGDLRWVGPASVQERTRPVLIYTPNVFEQGSSLSHFSRAESGALMRPDIRAGVTNRRFAPFEVKALVDLGYVNARSLDESLLSFETERTFKTAGAVRAALGTDVDSDRKSDLVILENGASGSVLRVYSDLNPVSSYSCNLGRDYARMSAMRVGPGQLSGIVLNSVSGGTVLSLGGLDVATAKGASCAEDFSHAHAVGRTASGRLDLFEDSTDVPVFDIDLDGVLDVVSLSTRGDITTFWGDGDGYLDRLRFAKRYPNLSKSNPALDLAAFTGDEAGYEQNLYLEVPHGSLASNGRISRFVPHKAKQTQVFLSGRVGNRRIDRLDRLYNYGYAVLEDYLADVSSLVRLDGPPSGSGPLKFSTLGQYSDMGDVHLAYGPYATEEPLAWFTTDTGHTVHQIPRGTSVPTKITGSVQGYNDGPASKALFDRPSSLCSDTDAVYVADYGNSVIRRIDQRTLDVTTVAGLQGVKAYKDGPKGTASFYFRGGRSGPCAVIGDSLFVLDGKPRAPDGRTAPIKLRKVNLNNGHVTTVKTRLNPDRFGAFTLDVWKNRLFILNRVGQNAYVSALDAATVVPHSSGGLIAQAADVDGDGVPDLLLRTRYDIKTVVFMLGDGQGGFREISRTILGSHPNSLETINIKGNVGTDMVIGFADRIETYIEAGGRFTEDASRQLEVADSVKMMLVDANDDGWTDVAWIDSRGDMRIVLADDTGRWTLDGPGRYGEDYRKSTGVGSPKDFEMSDLNNDGKIDLLVFPVQKQNVTLLLGN